MGKKSFYKDLPYIEDFNDVTDNRCFKDIPPEWYILVTDVRNSTIAVEEGRYKEVNFVAACGVSAVMNIDKQTDFPFVFGGDGATMLIPPESLEQAYDALRDTYYFALKEFGLELRIGAVPVMDILRRRTKVRIAKMKVGENFYQAVFKGGGLEEAETLVKSDPKYIIEFKPPRIRADYSGLQCIWQDFPGKKEEVVSLLIKANNSVRDESQVYSDVMSKIQSIYGSKEKRFPIKVRSIRIGTNIQKIYLESILQAYVERKSKSVLFVKNFVNESIKWFLNKIKLGIKALTLRAYKSTVLSSVDSEKFDDMLRMVISGNSAQRHQLVGYLEERYQAGELAYGVHTTQSVYMTCLFFERKGQQVHFVDGSNGGYTAAAKEFKNRIKWQKVYMKTY